MPSETKDGHRLTITELDLTRINPTRKYRVTLSDGDGERIFVIYADTTSKSTDGTGAAILVEEEPLGFSAHVEQTTATRRVVVGEQWSVSGHTGEVLQITYA